MKRLVLLIFTCLIGVFVLAGTVLAQPLVKPLSSLPLEGEMMPSLGMPYLGEVFFKFGDAVVLDKDVLSDAFLAGNQVQVDGRVRGDLLAAGSEVIVNGWVDQDVRIAGGVVRLEGVVGRNVSVVGGRIIVDDSARVNGSLVAVGGSIDIGSQAQIAGKKYLKIIPSLNVEGRADSVGRQIGHAFGVVAAVVAMVHWLSILLIGLLLMRLFPKTIKVLLNKTQKDRENSLVVGAAASILLPVLALLLLFTVIGIPVAILIMFTMIVGLYLARFLAMVFVGQWLYGKLKDKRIKIFQKDPTLYVNFLLGLVVFLVLEILPFVGWLIKLLLVWLCFGVLVKGKLACYKKLER